MGKIRPIKDIEIDKIQNKVDWEKLASLIPRKRSRVGRKPDYTENQLLRLVILQDIEEIEDDTEMERRLNRISEYREFCQLDKAPSHDTISRFKRKLPHKVWKNIHESIDKTLEKLGVFKKDELCGDGTKIPLPQNVEIGSWGATSDENIFFGLFLITVNSTKTELVRDFNIGTAEIGQIVLMEHLIRNTTIQKMEKLGENVYLDGIFDTHSIRQYIFRKWKKIPMIPYNPRSSSIRNAKDLPDDNWRLVFTPNIRDEGRFKKESRKRTGVERENGRLKQWTLLGKLYDKAKRSFRITGKYIVNQMIISLISTQVRALAYKICELMQPVVIQTSLNSF
jgi:transposase